MSPKSFIFVCIIIGVVVDILLQRYEFKTVTMKMYGHISAYENIYIHNRFWYIKCRKILLYQMLQRPFAYGN